MRTLAAWCHDRRRTVIGLWVAAFVVCRRAVGHRRRRVRQQLQPAGHGVPAGLRPAQGQVPAAVGRHRQRRLRGRPGQRARRRQPPADRGGPRRDQEVARGARRRRSVRRGRARLQGRQDHVRPDPVPQGAPATSTPTQVKTMAEDTLKLDGKGGVQVALGGDIIHWSTAEQGGAGEIFGILVAALVLFLTLGVVAMGLPLLNALFAMVVSLVADGGRRHPPARRRRLDAAAGGDDRHRRRHRLRAADPQPLPARTRRRARRARGDAGRDRHVRPRRAVRGHRRRDRDARHDAARHLVPLRARRSAPRSSVLVTMAAVADADAGAAEQDRRPRSSRRRNGGERRPARPASPRAGAASSRAGRCRWRSSRSPC